MYQKKAVFLDRDGTLNQDFGYTHRIRDWRWLPGTLAGMRILADAGYALVVVSNQSGIDRGYYTLAQVKALEEWVDKQLALKGLKIDAWYYCPHLPEAGCSCRKPGAGMLHKAAEDLRIDLSQSWMLGDRVSDAQAGAAAGCRAGLIFNPLNPDEGSIAGRILPGIQIWADLEQAATAIISDKPAS